MMPFYGSPDLKNSVRISPAAKPNTTVVTGSRYFLRNNDWEGKLASPISTLLRLSFMNTPETPTLPVDGLRSFGFTLSKVQRRTLEFKHSASVGGVPAWKSVLSS
jgi:hypothetical protein